ncbi:MAG: hypothetical protein JWR00_831 [Rubritepida sp.]|nr:hypothetical protein [Rubritepida sp.]
MWPSGADALRSMVERDRMEAERDARIIAAREGVDPGTVTCVAQRQGAETQHRPPPLFANGVKTLTAVKAREVAVSAAAKFAWRLQTPPAPHHPPSAALGGPPMFVGHRMRRALTAATGVRIP